MILLAALMLFSMTAGCGSSEDEPGPENGMTENGVSEDPGHDDEDVDGNGEFAFDYWENPQNISELVELFKQLKFDISTGDHISSIVYRFEGKETASGVETSKVTMETYSNGQLDLSLTTWVDDNGSTVQIAIDDEMMPAELASMMAEPIFSLVFMPFNLVSAYDPEVVLGGTHPNINVESKGTSSRTFGDLSGKIYESVISVTDQGREYKVEWHIGDFGNLQMMTLYETLDVSANDYVRYELSTVELR